jgi:hypothetical protein
MYGWSFLTAGQAAGQGNAGVLFAALGLAILIVTPVLVYRARRRKAQEVRENEVLVEPGQVRFLFHQYSGLLIYVRITAYDEVLPVEVAETLLKQLVRHNLTRGLLVRGGIFVPMLTFFEWRAQSKRNRAARGG